jgi:RHS repeat-associated protein
MVRRYELSYEGGSSIFDKSRLHAIDISGDGFNYRVNTFCWHTGPQSIYSGGFSAQEWQGMYGSDGPIQTGDFNGDGKTDIMMWRGTNNDWTTNLSTGSGFISQEWQGMYGSDGPIKTGDFNGDGKTDIMMWRGANNDWTVNLSTRSGFISQEWQGMFGSDGPIQTGDFNGDGRTDVMMWRGANNDWTVNISTGSGFISQEWHGMYGSDALDSGKSILTGDFNGDGKTDVLMWRSANNDWTVNLSTGIGFIPQEWQGMYGSDGPIKTGDFNGDGKTDVMMWRGTNNDWTVNLSTGSSFVPQEWHGMYGSDALDSGKSILTGDFNNDGKTDVMMWRGANNDWTVNLSTGSGFIPQEWQGMYGSDGPIKTGDFNGDGKTDVMMWRGANNDWTTNLTSNSHNDTKNLITSISTSSGATTQIQYQNTRNLPGAYNPAVSSYPIVANSSARDVVTQVITHDGMGNQYGTSYAYANAKTYKGSTPDKTKSLGFETFTVTNNETGAKQITRFYQTSRDLAQKTQSVVNLDRLGRTTGEESTTYQVFASGLGNTLVKPQQVTSTKYETGTAYATSIASYSNYDGYGNARTVTQQLVGDETITQSTQYLNDTSRWVLGLPVRKTTQDGSGVVINEMVSSYNSNGSLLRQAVVYEGREIATTYDYDTFGNVTKKTNAKGNSTTFNFDDDFKTYQAKVINSLGHSVTYEYDYSNGNLLSVEDVNGFTTSKDYDTLGRVVSEFDNDGNLLKEYEYSPLWQSGNIHTQYNKTRTNIYNENNELTNSVEVLKFYDGLGRNYKTISTLAENEKYDLRYLEVAELNAAGQVIKKSKPTLIEYTSPTNYIIKDSTVYYTLQEFDDYDRVIKVTKPDGSTITTSYTIDSEFPNSLRRTITQSDGRVYHEVMNTKQQLLKKTEPGNLHIYYEYNSRGQMSKVLHPDGISTEISYDAIGRRSSVKEPNTGTKHYKYDDLNNITEVRDEKGNVTSYEYDAVNRLKRVSFSDDTPEITYVYDDPAVKNSKGKLTKVYDSVSTMELAYENDQLPSVKKYTIDEQTYIFKMKYDSSNRVRTLTYPDGETIEKEYSDNDHITSLKWGGSDVVRYAKFKLDESGNIENFDDKIYRRAGNGIETEITYDPINMRPTNITSVKVGSTDAIEDIDYEYDIAGNITLMQDNLDAARTQRFVYDDLYRMKSAEGLYGTYEYKFASNGNLLEKEGLALSYNNSAHPHAVSSDSDGNEYTYDANGNMTYRKGKNLIYDAKNRLIDVMENGRSDESYYYNFADSRMRVKRKDGVVVHSLEGLFEAAKYPSGKTLYTKYFYGLENEVVGQATEHNSELMESHLPYIINSYYNTHSLQGLWMYGVCYTDYLIVEKNLFGKIAVAVLILFSLFVIYYSARYFNYMREKTGQSVLVLRLSPALLVVFMMVFGLSGCFLFPTDGKSDGDKAPWENIEEGESGSGIETTGLAQTGMLFFHPDYTGNISYVTDKDGIVVNQITYKPYGEIYEMSGNNNFAHKFNSHKLDEETKLVFANARYYDPSLGRFITADTLVPNLTKVQSLNKYMYVEGSPFEYSDKSGHWPGKGWAKRAARKVKRAASRAKRAAKKVAGKVKATVKAVNKVAKKIGKAAKEVGKAVGDIAEVVADKAGDTALNVLDDAAKQISNSITDVTSVVTDMYDAYQEGGLLNVALQAVSVVATVALTVVVTASTGQVAVIELELSYSSKDGFGAGAQVTMYSPTGNTISLSAGYTQARGFETGAKVNINVGIVNVEVATNVSYDGKNVSNTSSAGVNTPAGNNLAEVKQTDGNGSASVGGFSVAKVVPIRNYQYRLPDMDEEYQQAA